jgi:hypothetical protein
MSPGRATHNSVVGDGIPILRTPGKSTLDTVVRDLTDPIRKGEPTANKVVGKGLDPRRRPILTANNVVGEVDM